MRHCKCYGNCGMTNDEYLKLITAEHSDKPKFMSTVGASIAPIVRAQELIASLPERFDLDMAIGDQLDAVGLWAGITRHIRVPIADAYFRWNDGGIIASVSNVGGKALFQCVGHEIVDGKLVTVSGAGITAGTYKATTNNSLLTGAGIDAFGLYLSSVSSPSNSDMLAYVSNTTGAWYGENTGWGMGSWKADDDPSYGIVDLDDEHFRILIKTKIAANNWDGTIPAAYKIWETLFGPDTKIIIADHQNMSITVAVTGISLTPVFKAILEGGYIPLKPAGVSVNQTLTTTLFEFDAEADTVKGWDSGSWGSGL